MEIYQKSELLQPNLIQKLFKITPNKNFGIELNNLLASNQQDIMKVTLDQVFALAQGYKVNPKKSFKPEREFLFRKYLLFCLSDLVLEDREINELKHLSEVLMLNENDMYNIVNKESEKLYEKEVKNAVQDGKLDQKEKAKLELIQQNLLISKETADSIYSKNASEILQKFLEDKISDERLSPTEEKEIADISRSLGIELQLSDSTSRKLDKYRLYWQIENADLPVLNSDINLQKSESLHFKVYVNWLEQRRVTKRINYSGPTARIKLAKGVYYRVGSIKAQSITEDVWQLIDRGSLYLTNKRLIFMGSKGNKIIQINKILDFSPFTNGVEIQRETGKSPFLGFDNNVDIFSMMLARLQYEQ
jgi:hypothetical protein